MDKCDADKSKNEREYATGDEALAILAMMLDLIPTFPGYLSK